MLTIPQEPTLQAMMAVAPTGSDLWVGAGQQYKTIGEALAVAQDGDTIYIEAGTYDISKDPYKNYGQLVVDADVRLIGVGGYAHITSSSQQEKGLIQVKPGNSLYVENLELSGADSSSNNGSAIRHQGDDLTVINSYIHDNEQGIKTTANSNSNIYIANTEFENNGYGHGLTHSIYVNVANTLVVTDSTFNGANKGMHIKSMAVNNWISDNYIDDGASTSSRSIDVTYGGDLYIYNNTIIQSASSDSRNMIKYNTNRGGVEGEVIVQNNTFINEHPTANVFYNGSSSVIQFYDNTITNTGGGVVQHLVRNGPGDIQGNTINSVAVPNSTSTPTNTSTNNGSTNNTDNDISTITNNNSGGQDQDDVITSSPDNVITSPEGVESDGAERQTDNEIAVNNDGGNDLSDIAAYRPTEDSTPWRGFFDSFDWPDVFQFASFNTGSTRAPSTVDNNQLPAHSGNDDNAGSDIGSWLNASQGITGDFPAFFDWPDAFQFASFNTGLARAQSTVDNNQLPAHSGNDDNAGSDIGSWLNASQAIREDFPAFGDGVLWDASFWDNRAQALKGRDADIGQSGDIGLLGIKIQDSNDFWDLA